MMQLQNEAQRQKFTSSAWIGLYNDINSWRWSFGNEPLGSMTMWAAGEPNNMGGREECSIMDQIGWGDSACALTLPFLCFNGEEQLTFHIHSNTIGSKVSGHLLITPKYAF